MLVLPWIVVAALLLLPQFRASSGSSAPATAYDDYVLQARPGPWGELQYSRLLIEPPDEFTPNDPVGNPQPVWFFNGYSSAQLDALWQSAGLASAARTALQSAPRENLANGGFVLRPPEDIVLGLSPEARTVIYSALAAFPENQAQNEPFRFRADTAEEWFEHSEVSAQTLQLVKRLLYRRGTSLLFSDLDLVLDRIASRAERINLIKTLARKSTLLVKLRLRPDANIDELTDYWGRGPRRKGLRALLQSISRRPQGITIDIAHLLPRFARTHLFTYPQATSQANDLNHDCHWTSLNFFNDPVDESFSDIGVVKQTLEQRYVRVNSTPQLGDVLVFIRPDGTVIHSCVYIADEIVFTKNGASEVMPWILMNLSDVIAFYPADPALKVHVYRRRDL